MRKCLLLLGVVATVAVYGFPERAFHHHTDSESGGLFSMRITPSINYFGTYPNAANLSGEPVFTAKPNTPGVNGLTPGLLTSNPNSTQPFRLDRSQAR